MIAYNDADERAYVPLATYTEGIELLAAELALATNERDEARADANAAFKYATELRLALAKILHYSAGYLSDGYECAYIECRWCEAEYVYGQAEEDSYPHTDDCPITIARALLDTPDAGQEDGK